MTFNEIDVFNNGCDLVLSNLEDFIVRIESSEEPTDVKYEKILRMVVGMRQVLDKRAAPKEEQPEIIVPDSQIIISN